MNVEELDVLKKFARSADEDEADTSAQRTSKHNLMYSILLSVAQ